MTKKPSILFLGTQMSLEGAQSVLLTQAVWFHNQGYRVTAIFFYDKHLVYQDWIERYPFRIINLDCWKKESSFLQNLFRLPKGIIKLIQIVREIEFDIIETFTIDSNIIGIPISYLFNIPTRIASHHGIQENYNRTIRKLHGMIVNSKMCSKLVAVSTAVSQLAVENEGVNPQKIEIIRNGIIIPNNNISKKELEAFYSEIGVPRDSVIITNVGRLVHVKGQIFLLQVISTLLNKYPNIVLLMVGQGYLWERFHNFVEEKNIENHVRFLGNRRDVETILASSDMFVSSSLSEGFSISILEAMAMGLPVIATSVGGNDELITDRENGLLVPQKNNEMLEKAIIELINNPDFGKSLGANAKKTAISSYSQDQMCKAYEELFNQFSI